MNMGWLESLIYGLFSGISEFLPISSSAHQQILMHLFGIDARDPVRDFIVHAAMLIAAYMACRSFWDTVKRETLYAGRRQYANQQNFRVLHDKRLIQSAILPMLISMFFIRYVLNIKDNLLLVSFLLVINGVILFLPDRMVQGNKDARFMSTLDSVLIGCSGALSAFSGISRIGCTYGVAIARGAAKRHALAWSLILSIPALVCVCIMDFIAFFSVEVIGFWSSFFTYILSGVMAYIGSYIAISFMRFLTARPSSSFAYYCWGVSLFSFVLYLTIG